MGKVERAASACGDCGAAGGDSGAAGGEARLPVAPNYPQRPGSVESGRRLNQF